MKRLHLGCGSRIMYGWINIDLSLDPNANIFGSDFLRHDLRESLPYADACVDRVFSEHFFEHIQRADAVRLLRECHRVMAPGGVIRVSVPDLKTLVDKYLARDLDFARVVGWVPASPAQLLNEGMRMWDHVFMYDAEELMNVFLEAGFKRENVRWVEHGATKIPDMPTEGRPCLGDLVFEAQR